jgi:8-oxo-dGTP pyrophosphatase MutT (NUDIX family)
MKSRWRYGNYCGPGPKFSNDCSSLDNGNPLPEPINKVDMACKIHDTKYCMCGNTWKNSFPGTPCTRNSDEELLNYLNSLIKNKEITGHEFNAANLITKFFKAHHTFGNLLFPSLNFKEWLENVNEEDYTNGFWAGEGNAASGILPIALDTKKLCLAYRSPKVHMGNTFGTIGGAIQKDKSPHDSALSELKEETDYSGQIKLIPAYVFKSGSFTYFNFLGLIPREVPIKTVSYENVYTKWYSYDELTSEQNFHPGLSALLSNSKPLIESYVGEK